MDLVTVCSVNDEFSAQSISDLLDQSGIPVIVRKNILPGFDIALPSAISHGWGEILVRQADLEKARELIAGFMGGLGELAEATEEPEA